MDLATPLDPDPTDQPPATPSPDAAPIDSEIRAVLEQVPGFEPDSTTWSWLSGGGAHRNFLASCGNQRVVIKLWNRMWEGVAVIPPAPVVLHNTTAAGRIGIGAPVRAVVTDPLALVVDFLPGGVMVTEGDLWIPRLAAKTRELHDSDVRFANDYNPFAEARKMFASARHLGADMPTEILELESDIAAVENTLDLRVNEFVPCHNDLYGPNVLDVAGELRLIDYDLSGMGDRCYDLGFTSAYFEMNLDQISRLCESYFGGIDHRSVARARLFAVAADWAALGLWLVALSLADTNDDYDYAGELANSLRRVQKCFDAPDFGEQLTRARR